MSKNPLNDKKELELRSQHLQQEVDEQLSEIVDKAERWGRNVLLVSGGLIIAYKLYVLMTSDDEAENIKGKKQYLINKLVDMLGKQALIIALDFARKKLIEYLSQTDAVASIEEDNDEGAIESTD